MALRTGHGGMRSRQRIVRIKSVIECGIVPRQCGVANTAVVRQSQLHVRRIRRVLKINSVSVAAIAISRRSLVFIIGVARDTGQSGVRPGQRISCIPQVVKLRAKPAIHGVAVFAGSGEAETLVVDHRRQEVLPMARFASR